MVIRPRSSRPSAVLIICADAHSDDSTTGLFERLSMLIHIQWICSKQDFQDETYITRSSTVSSYMTEANISLFYIISKFLGECFPWVPC